MLETIVEGLGADLQADSVCGEEDAEPEVDFMCGTDYLIAISIRQYGFRACDRVNDIQMSSRMVFGYS